MSFGRDLKKNRAVPLISGERWSKLEVERRNGLWRQSAPGRSRREKGSKPFKAAAMSKPICTKVPCANMIGCEWSVFDDGHSSVLMNVSRRTYSISALTRDGQGSPWVGD